MDNKDGVFLDIEVTVWTHEKDTIIIQLILYLLIWWTSIKNIQAYF